MAREARAAEVLSLPQPDAPVERHGHVGASEVEACALQVETERRVHRASLEDREPAGRRVHDDVAVEQYADVVHGRDRGRICDPVRSVRTEAHEHALLRRRAETHAIQRVRLMVDCKVVNHSTAGDSRVRIRSRCYGNSTARRGVKSQSVVHSHDMFARAQRGEGDQQLDVAHALHGSGRCTRRNETRGRIGNRSEAASADDERRRLSRCLNVRADASHLSEPALNANGE